MFPEKAIDMKMITLPLSEYEKLINEASNTYKDAKIKEMQSKINELNITILDWKERYAALEKSGLVLIDGNNFLLQKLALKEREIIRLRNKRKWWRL